eukprot:gene3360-6652_t
MQFSFTFSSLICVGLTFILLFNPKICNGFRLGISQNGRYFSSQVQSRLISGQLLYMSDKDNNNEITDGSENSADSYERSDIENEDNGPTIIRKPPSKKKPKIPQPTDAELAGFVYKDEKGVEFDVPFSSQPMWYRLLVKKNNERKVYEAILELKKQQRWANVLEDAFYPRTPFVRFKGNNVVLDSRPMVIGLLYVKTAMNPIIADAIEGIEGIYGLGKDQQNKVVPLFKEEEEQFERMRNETFLALDPEITKIRKEEYVTVVSGPQEGRYGIIMGARNGQLEVCLRSENRDEWHLLPANQLRYLDNPPEKKWKTMTAKEAVESLMAKDPRNPTLKALKDQGLLEEILYPEGRPETRRDSTTTTSFNAYGEKDFDGRGKRIRSIAKPEPPAPRPFPSTFTDRSSSSSSSVARGGRESDGFKSTEDDWGGVFDNTDNGRSSKQGSAPPSSNDLDDFIQDLLGKMDGDNNININTSSMEGDALGHVLPFFAADLSKDKKEAFTESETDTETVGRKSWEPKSTGTADSFQKQRSPQPSSSFDSRDRSSVSSSDYRDSSRSSSTRGGMSSSSSSSSSAKSQSQQDLDFNRDLDELLGFMDKDKDNSDSGRNDKKPSFNSGSSSSGLSSSGGIKGKSTGVNLSGSIIPQMEDFATFDEYLDALVSQDKETRSSSSRGRSGSASIANSADQDDGFDNLAADNFDDLVSGLDFQSSSSNMKSSVSPASFPASRTSYSNSNTNGQSQSRGSSQSGSMPDSVGGGGGGGGDSAKSPKMENYQSFEEYLDALVSHQKQSSSASPATGKNGQQRGGSQTRDLDNWDDDDLLGVLGDLESDNDDVMISRDTRSMSMSSSPSSSSSLSFQAPVTPAAAGFIVPRPADRDSDRDRNKNRINKDNRTPPKYNRWDAGNLDIKFDKPQQQSIPMAKPAQVEKSKPTPSSVSTTSFGDDFDDFFNSLDDNPTLYSDSRDIEQGGGNRGSRDMRTVNRDNTNPAAAAVTVNEPPVIRSVPAVFKADAKLSQENQDSKNVQMKSPVEAPRGVVTSTKSTGNHFEQQTIPELKEILKKNGLPVSGRKAELIDRITKANISPE